MRYALSQEWLEHCVDYSTDHPLYTFPMVMDPMNRIPWMPAIEYERDEIDRETHVTLREITVMHHAVSLGDQSV